MSLECEFHDAYAESQSLTGCKTKESEGRNGSDEKTGRLRGREGDGNSSGMEYEERKASLKLVG